MIRYRLHCAACGHDFDDWFSGSADWEARRASLACPACAAVALEKALMAPAVAAERRSAAPACEPMTCTNPACPMAAAG